MIPPSRSAITRGDILTVAAGLMVLTAVMVLSQAAFDLTWVLVYTVAAACAFEMARNLRWFASDDYPVFLALSVAMVAAFQLFHVAVELGLVPLGSRSVEAADHIALATGFVLAGTMLVAPFTVSRRISPALWGAAISLTAGLFVAAFVWWHIFAAAPEGTGVSVFAQAGDLVIAGMLLAAGALTWRRRRLLVREFRVAIEVALGVAAFGWALQALLRSDDITHLMSVLFISLICIAITRNGLARPTTLLFTQMREDKLQTLEELRVSEQRYRTVFEQSPAALFLFDAGLRVTGCNARLAVLLRTPEESIVGTDLRDLGEPNLTAVSESALNGQLAAYEGECRLGPSRDEQWVSVRAAPLFDAAERASGGIGIIVDMTEGKRAEQLIERLAFHDALTGLANRTLLRDRLRQTLASSERSATRVALLYVDIDRFADLNHLLGHAGADTVLQAVAARLQPLVREADTIARWGADEFVVVLQDVQGSDGTRRVVAKVHAALAESWHMEGHSFDVTASVGIALFPSDGEDADSLLEHGMIAAQEAKDRGGGHVSVLRSRHGNRDGAPHRGRAGVEAGASERGARTLLPASDRPDHRSHRRTGGTRTLAPSRPRSPAAGRFLTGGRVDRADREPHGMGRRRGLQAGSGMAGRRVSTGAHRREPVGARLQERRRRRDGGRRPAPERTVG